MKGEKRFNESDYKLAKKLRSVREREGLNQTEFYKKYLQELGVSDSSYDSSIQGYMKKLENGETPITPCILKTYAKLAECSIDAFLDINDDMQVESGKYDTFSDCAKDLLRLYENEKCHIAKTDKGKKYCITFENEKIIELLSELEGLEGLKDNRSYNSIYTKWKKTILEDGKKLKKREGASGNEYGYFNLDKLVEKWKF